MGSLSIIDDIRDYDEIIIIDAADIDSDVEVFGIKTELEDEIPQAVISMSLGGSSLHVYERYTHNLKICSKCVK